MQDTAVDKKQLKAMARIPFLADFPYPEFTFHYNLMQTRSTLTNEVIGSTDIILFKHENFADPLVNIIEKEIWHLYEIRDNVQKVNEVSEKVSSAFSSDDLLAKRDASAFAEKWFNEIEGKNFRIGAGTFSDIFENFVGRNKYEEIEQASILLNKLYEGKEVLIMTKDQKKVLDKYFQFQLVYYKILIGIIIAAKISL